MLLLPVTLLFGSFQTVGVLAKQSLTPWQYLLMQSQVITHYLVLVYWPSQLSICYIDWPVAHSLLDVWPWMLGIGGLFLIALYGVIRRRPWGLIGAWFFLILGPTSSLLPIVEEPAGERRMYLPLIAVVALTLVGLERLLRPVQKGTVLMILLLAGIVLSLSQATLWRNEDFSTSLSIWSDTAVKRPRDYRAQNNVGAELLKAGYLTESIPFFDRALELQPALVDSYINRGTALIYLHRNDEAFRDLKEAVRITPGLSSSWKTLGWALQIDRQYTAAAQCLKQALLLDPENEDAKRFLKQPATLPAASPMK
jgi:hypothetical protein